LVLNSNESNFGPILPRFRDIAASFVRRNPHSSIPHPYYGQHFGQPVMLGSAPLRRANIPG